MRLLALLLLFAMPVSVLAQTPVTVTGTITDAGNNPATSGYVQFDIMPKVSSIHYFVAGVGTITQTVQCPISGIGTINCTVWGNDVINPANTQYKVTFAPNGNITNIVSGECITGSAYNLSHPVFCPIVQINPQQTIVRANPFQTNIIPIAAGTFTIGSSLLPYGNIYTNAITLGGSLFTPANLAFLNSVNSFVNVNNFAAATNLNGGGTLSGSYSGTPNFNAGITGAGSIGSLTEAYSNLTGFPSACGANNFATQIAATPGCTQPSFASLSGNISTGQMNSGTGANGTTFWRGDGIWASGGVLGEQLLSVNTTLVSVNANSTFSQQLQTAQSAIAAGALNTIGKTVKITVVGTFTPVNTTETVQVQFQFGGGSSSNTIFPQFVPSSTNLYGWTYILTCTTTTTGVSGIVTCAGIMTLGATTLANGATAGGSTIGTIQYTNTNLTGAITPSANISFTTASTSNIGTSNYFLVEQLN